MQHEMSIKACKMNMNEFRADKVSYGFGKAAIIIAKNAETKYLSKKNRSENIARKGRRKLTKLRIF